MLVLGIDTSTRTTSIALGSEQRMLASMSLERAVPNHEMVTGGLLRLLEWAEVPVGAITGIAIGLGPGLFTGMRVGIATGKTLAQSLGIPVIGVASLDVVAFSARFSRRLICATIDARRGEIFYAFYRPVPGGVARETEFLVGPPARLTAELAARPEEILLVGDGGLVYRRELQEAGSRVEVASASHAFPSAAALVELTVPRFLREDFDRLYDVQPYYVRKADAEIAWDRRRGTA